MKRAFSVKQDFFSETDESDFDESKGRWVTISGRKVFIKKGQKVQFSKGGRFKVVSKEKFREKRGKREEKKKRKIMEEKGATKSTAELQAIKEVKEKRERRKKKLKYKKDVEAPKTKEEKRDYKEYRIERKKKAVEHRIERLKELNKSKSYGTILKELITLAAKILVDISQERSAGIIPFAQYIKKIKKDRNIKEKNKAKVISQINKLKSEIKELQPKKDFTDKILTPQDVANLFNKIKENVQEHIDFVNEHLDFLTEDVTGLPSELSAGQLKKLEEIESLLKTTPAVTGKTPDWFNYPMTPVMSSFVKGVGAYKGRLLVEYHHDPGNIHGYDVNDQEATLLPELLNSKSKGGWVWDKLLGKPSIYGMAKGTFHAFEKNGKWNYFTSKGAQFVHLFGRPLKYTYNPVGYLDNNKELYEQIAETTKKIKERIVEPPTSREPISAKLLEAEQGRRTRTLGEISTLIEGLPKDMMEINQIAKQVVRKVDLTEDYKVKGYYSTRGDPPKRIFIRRHTRGEGASIKDKPRMRPLEQWEIDENNTQRLAKFFGKEEYSDDFWMGKEKDAMGRQFHEKIRIADNVDYKRNNFSIALANSSLQKLPIEFQHLAVVVFFKNVTDDPNSTSDPDDIPAPYKKVGWDSKNKDVDAEISKRYKTIRIRAGSWRQTTSMRHEVGHAVYWWEKHLFYTTEFNRMFEKRQWHLRRQGKVGKYQANDINEFFAVQFERYYSNDFDKMFPETIEFFDKLNNIVGGSNKL